MASTYQFEKQSVAEHGRSVACYYLDLIQHIVDKKPLQKDWKLPDWVRSPYILNNLLPFQTTIAYLIYHDCGKPYCRTVDEDGKQHFPNHTQVSQEVFDEIRKGHQFSSDDDLVSQLIAEDMDIHMLKGDGVAEFAKRDTAPTQLLAGLSELHSNAVMFGGIDSIGFKSKFTNINRRGKAIVKILKEQSNAA
jgi:hypothetical protein